MTKQEFIDRQFPNTSATKKENAKMLDETIEYISKIADSLTRRYTKFIFRDIRNAVPHYLSKGIIESVLEIMVGDGQLIETEYISNYRGKGAPQKAWMK